MNTLCYKEYLPVLVLCLVLFEGIVHWNFLGEKMVYIPHHYATCYGATGCTNALNDVEFHVEATANLRNTHFFAGGTDSIYLGYEIATNRLLVPYLASLAMPFARAPISAVKTVNLALWMLAVWCAWLLGRDYLGGWRSGLALSVFVATAPGMLFSFSGMKGHHLSYSAFFIAVYFLERLAIFRKGASWRHVAVAGLMLGSLAFASNVFLPLYLYCVFRGLPTMGVLRLGLLGVVTAAPLLLIKLIIVNREAPSGDRTDAVLLQHFFAHMQQWWQYVRGKTVDEISFVHTTFNDPWLPFRWIPGFFKGLFGVFSWPVLGLAAVGLARLNRYVCALSLSIFFGVTVAVAGVHTYWPFWMFNGYTAYYAALAFFIAAASGVDLLAKSVETLATRARFPGASHMAALVLFMVLAGTIVLANEHLWSGRLAEVFRFYLQPTIDYPDSWDFRILEWQ